jgi:hypothetical protein
MSIVGNAVNPIKRGKPIRKSFLKLSDDLKAQLFLYGYLIKWQTLMRQGAVSIQLIQTEHHQ